MFVLSPKGVSNEVRRFNRTLQDELVDDNLYDLEDTDEFNDKMSDYLFLTSV